MHSTNAACEEIRHAGLFSQQGPRLQYSEQRICYPGADQIHAVLAASSSSSDGSPLRRALKAELLASAAGQQMHDNRTALPTDMLLDLELKEQKLAATSQQKEVGRLMLEKWVDDVLSTAKPEAANGAGHQEQSHHLLQHQHGAAAAGLARHQLFAAGLSMCQVDNLYRSLYVYSAGFSDAMKELLGSNEHRQELLQAVWKAFMSLAEHAMKAAFKSDYMALVSTAGSAMAELLCSKQALSEAHRDNAELVKELGWLSAAEAESGALRRGLRSQVDELQTALSLEQKAHQHAVKQYVDALDAKSTMTLQLQEMQRQLEELQQAHSSLQQQHHNLQGKYDTLTNQCIVVQDVFKQVDAALGLDAELAQHMKQQQQQPLGSDYMQPLALNLQRQCQLMYHEWRSAVDARAACTSKLYGMQDQLRQEHEALFQAQQQHGSLQKNMQKLNKQLEDSQADAADLTARLSAAHETAASHLLNLEDVQNHLQLSRQEAAALQLRCTGLQDDVDNLHDQLSERVRLVEKLDGQLSTAQQKLTYKHRLMAEVSKGFAVAMQSLTAQQTGRRVLHTALVAERRQRAHMSSSLEGRDARLHDLDAQVQEQTRRIASMANELSLLESSLQDSQRQSMNLNARLTLCEAKNDELLSQSQAQADQLSAASTKLNKTTAKLEVTQGNLEKSAREIKDLREAAQVSERLLGEARLTAKSLTADVERITKEKRDVQERAEATKGRLELEVQRLKGDLSAADRKAELVAADLAAERDRTSATATALERKRGKKRRWKENCSTYSAEALALHQQLLSKQQDADAFESRLQKLETELKVLGIKSRVRLRKSLLLRAEESATEQREAGAAGDGRAGSPGGATLPASRVLGEVVVVDLQAARKAFEAAAAEASRLGNACLKLDAGLEALEVEQQQLLLKLAAPDLSVEQVQGIRQAAAGKLSELKGLRKQRQELEASRTAASIAVKQTEVALREAQQARLQQRQSLLEQQALQVSDMANAAALAQLEAAEAAEAGLQEQLAQQLAAFDQAQADKADLAERLISLQAGIDSFLERISAVQDDRSAEEEKVKRAESTISFLQAEVASLKSERERIKALVSASEARVAALQAELETTKQAMTVSLKGLEAQHAAEKALQEQKQLAERTKASQVARAAEAASAALQTRCLQLKAGLEMMAGEARALKQGARHQLPNQDGNTAAASACSWGSRSPSPTPGSASGGGSGAAGWGCSMAASDAGAGGADGPIGTRWVYLHQQSGPWTFARQALASATSTRGGVGTAVAGGASVSGVLGSRSSSIAGSMGGSRQPADGVFSASGQLSPGGALCLPAQLPGLDLSPDYLNILIGELYLNKITSDTAADTSSSASNVLAASSRQAAEEAAALSSGSSSGLMGAAGSLSPEGAAGSRQPVVPTWCDSRLRRDLEGSVYDFFLHRFGVHQMVEVHCTALVAAVMRASGTNPRARLLGRCLGLLDPVVPPAGVGTLVHFLAQVHSICGPLKEESTAGSSQVVCRTAISLSLEVLRPTLAAPCPEVSRLAAGLTAAAGGSTDNPVDVDECLEVLLEAWLAQRAADLAQLENLFKMVDTRGCGINRQEKFALLLKQLNQLFMAALRASGPSAAAITGTGAALALLDAGLAGSGAHLRQHPVIPHAPPYSQCRLLEESWRAVKPSLQELLQTLPKSNPALISELQVLQAST
eukprot:gene5684-5922_t